MKKYISTILITIISIAAISQTKIPTSDIQIKSALLAAPPDKRNAASVYGYIQDGSFSLLRRGSNELICLADDPKQPGFSVACYHRDLEPFMKRGRELKKAGKTTQEIFAIREKEVKDGQLKMPKNPTSLFVFSADNEQYNPVTGDVKNGYLRSVVYIPYATAESTGLPLKPQEPGMPWIMHPGTHGAHIMINPPK